MANLANPSANNLVSRIIPAQLSPSVLQILSMIGKYQAARAGMAALNGGTDPLTAMQSTDTVGATAIWTVGQIQALDAALASTQTNLNAVIALLAALT